MSKEDVWIETYCTAFPKESVNFLVGTIGQRKQEYLRFCKLSAEERKSAKEKKHFMSVAMQLLCKHAMENIAESKRQFVACLADYERAEDNIMTTFCQTVLERLSYFEELQKESNSCNKFSGVLPLAESRKDERKKDAFRAKDDGDDDV